MKFILITLYRLIKKIVFYLGYKLEIKKKIPLFSNFLLKIVFNIFNLKKIMYCFS